MPATVLDFPGAQRGGKTALQWHHLKALSAAMASPIVCVSCRRPHHVPPLLGTCACGGCYFGIVATVADPQALELDFHGGEQ